MTRIAPVNLAFNPKTLWFDAGELDIAADDKVVVSTARGIELGEMAGPVWEASSDELSKLKTGLKPVKRVATPEDMERAAEMREKSLDAMTAFREVAAKHNENMHPVSVEFLLEGDKAVFYFEAEERLDFRDIVRELASMFGVRIDMRQIGVRDEARMVGGLGHCGQELCCKRMGGDFNPVSIRMAKEQGLSLNPQKISGVCGRLMCCLRYEYEAYKDFHSRAPKQNATVQTPDGPAKVANLDVPREIVDLKIEVDGKMKTVHVPLAEMEPPEEEGARPKVVGEEAWRRAIEPPISSAASALFLTSQFTGNDTLGESRAVRRNNANVKNATGSTSMVELPKKSSGRRRRNRGGQSGEPTTTTPDTTRVRRRRSTTVSADGTKTVKDAAELTDAAPRAIRPGHKSSSLAAGRGSAETQREPLGDDAHVNSNTSRSRRRRHRGGSGRGGRSSEQSAAPGLPSGAPGQGDRRSQAAEGAGEAAGKSSGDSRHRRRRRRRETGESSGEGAQNEA